MQMQPALSISSSRNFAPAVPQTISGDEAVDAPAGLAALGAVLSLNRGAAVYREGDPALHWYRVVSGTGCTSKLLPDGRRQIGTFLHAGNFFGFDAFDEHGFAAEALTDMVVIRYPRKRTDALALTDGAVNRCIREIACRSLTAAYERLLTVGRKTATERVVTFLLELARGAPDGRTVSLPMSRSDIGDYLGLTLESVSRILSALKHDGLIEMAGAHRLVLLDRIALEQITAGDEPAVRLARA
ncbi:helix-turn-helix domain-containing protein [Mycobacterium sp. KBS0706]|uniref:helix-turn-helix domain-containing protein n=1 Tax=Mycobacterium sp. KBS0706 TaxID=2578109 RepID=UPI00163D9B34|nr:helix-turn-helix domain-containing protein [Mycobacterium sp. KBS0706]